MVWLRLALAALKRQNRLAVTSRRELAYDCGLSREAVRHHLAALERLGFIQIERGQRPDGGADSNAYRLLRGPYATPGQILTTPPPENGPPPGQKTRGAKWPPSQESQESLITKTQEHTPQAPRGEGPAELPFNSEAFRTAWTAWTEHRRQKRAKLTPVAAGRQLDALGKLPEAEAIETLERATLNGWTGLHPRQADAATGRPAPADGDKPRTPTPLGDLWK